MLNRLKLVHRKGNPPKFRINKGVIADSCSDNECSGFCLLSVTIHEEKEIKFEAITLKSDLKTVLSLQKVS